MHALAPAKINLYLHVTGKRDDGYHLLDSLVVFADFGDEIWLETNDELSLIITGQFGENLPCDDDNLIIQAAKLLQKEFAITQGAKIKLIKNLPIASGIGGGSSDAATTMLMLNKLWNLNLTIGQLAQLALPLGADMPTCLYQKTMVIGGIGEQITLFSDFPELHIVLVNPLIEVSSGTIYKKGFGNFSSIVGQELMEIYKKNNIYHIMSQLALYHNDLQNNAIKIAPEIGELLASLSQFDGCIFARMSGSGATCFAVCANKVSVEFIAKKITQQYPNYWVKTIKTI